MTKNSKCGKYKLYQQDGWITIEHLGQNIWMSKSSPDLVINLFSKWMNVSFL